MVRVNCNLRLVLSYKVRYQLGNQLLSKGHSTPFISNLKKPTCDSKQDMFELATLQYFSELRVHEPVVNKGSVSSN